MTKEEPKNTATNHDFHNGAEIHHLLKSLVHLLTQMLEKQITALAAWQANQAAPRIATQSDIECRRFSILGYQRARSTELWELLPKTIRRNLTGRAGRHQLSEDRWAARSVGRRTKTL